MTKQGNRPVPKVRPSLEAIRSAERPKVIAGETPKVAPSLAAIRSRRSARVSNAAAGDSKPARSPVALSMGAAFESARNRNARTAARRDPGVRRRLRSAIVQAAGKLSRSPLLLRPDLEAAIRARAGQ